MTEKMLNSTPSGMTRRSSLSSLPGKDFLELVWDNGQVLVQGGSSNRPQNTVPSYIGYPINPSGSKEGTGHEDAIIAERTRLGTVYSLLDQFPPHRDSDPSSSHQSSDQHSCQFDLQFSQSKKSSKLQEGFASLRSSVKESKVIGNVHQPPTATGSTQLCSYSSQQCLPSASLKKPRMDSGQTPAATKSHTQYLGCNQRTGMVNFPNFLVPALLLKSAYQGNNANQPTRHNASSARMEEIEAGKVEKATVAAATSRKGHDHSVVIESSNKATQELKGFREQTSLTASKSNPVSLVERPQVQPLDEHSEAVGHHNNNSALRIQGSHGQQYNKASSSAAHKAKGIADNTDMCNEHLLASSSVCSLGASNEPNIGIRKHEDTTDDTTYLSDDDEETEDVVKETPARDGTRAKRSRNPEIHNLSERKRRDKINKKIRALKELIPNCNKMDKASTLDDAIDYLKTLKLQLQIMSMGSGLCMPLMMLPAATHHVNVNAPHLPQLMGAGMCFRPGIGIPCSTPQFPIPPLPAITDNTLRNMFGFSNQMRPIPPISHAPFIPMTGNSSTPPLMSTSTATNLGEHLANSSTLEVSDLHAKAEYAAKQAANNQVSLHHSISYPFYFPTMYEEKRDNGQEGKTRIM